MSSTERIPRIEEMKLKIFADGADLDSIIDAYQRGLVKGFTTNPTLMSKAGITNYMTFATEVLRVVTDLPVSFEVFSDEFDGMRAQALKLAELGENVYVKIPVTNTRRETACPLIRDLAGQGIKLNITAILSPQQVEAVAHALRPDVPAIVSVFAGRIADTGRDPVPIMKQALDLLKSLPRSELLWASPREALNIVQAERIGCHIITVTPPVLEKAKYFNMPLEDLSLETVKMFYRDAVHSGFEISELK